jgi:hypothetical protein
MSGHKYELQKGLLREIRSKIAPQSIANRCGVVQFVRQSDQQSVVRFPGLIVRGAMYGRLKLRVGQSGRFCEIVYAEATTRRRCGSVRSRAVEKPLAAARQMLWVRVGDALEISVQQLWAPGKNSVMYERWTPVSGQPIERALDFGSVGE